MGVGKIPQDRRSCLTAEVTTLLSSTKSKLKIVIPDYSTGNVNSVKRTFSRIAVDLTVSSSADDIASADKIVLPGVGHFDTAMGSLNDCGLTEVLNDAVLIRRKPVLGICLGMELMATSSEEGDLAGLGWIDARAVRFSIADTSRYKVPHMGWNTLSHLRSSRLLEGVSEDAEFYFAHAYHLQLQNSAVLLAQTEYESTFASAIEKDNIFGVQFHPEKSQEAGMRILQNFVDLM